MSGMNPWLASIYGTDEADNLEKTAQAHMLQKLAADSNLDISQFSPEELEQLVQELAAEGYDVGALMQPQQAQPQMPGMQPQQPQAFAPAAQAPAMNPSMMQQAQPQMNGGPGAEAMQKEAQAKFDEADLLGRVMAHAYTDELEKIAEHRKTAGRFGAAKESLKGAVSHARNRAGHIAERAGARAHSKLTEVGMKARHHKREIGAGVVGAAAGHAVGRMHHKEASAFEKMAEEHAAEILSATGFDPSTGQDTYGQQMQQQAQQPQQDLQGQQGVQQPALNSEQQYAEALDQRALEMLAQNGYDINEIIARIQMQQNQAPQGQV